MMSLYEQEQLRLARQIARNTRQPADHPIVTIARKVYRYAKAHRSRV